MLSSALCQCRVVCAKETRSVLIKQDAIFIVRVIFIFEDVYNVSQVFRAYPEKIKVKMSLVCCALPVVRYSNSGPLCHET